MRFIQLTILILALQSCTNVKKQDNQLMSYLKNEKNQLTKKVIVNNSEITVKYIPKEVEMMVNKEKGFDTVNENYDDFLYFKVNIYKRDSKTEDKNTINHLNFYIQNDFKLVNISDTITPAICERINNGIKDDNEYMVVFTKPVKLSDKFSLIYDDKLFGVGKQEFAYNTNKFKKISSLKN